jgi:hypothetical protein
LGFRCFAVAVQKADRLRERYRSRRNRGASARGACSGFLKDRPAISLLAMRTDGTRCPAAEHAIRRGGQARASRLETVIAARAFSPEAMTSPLRPPGETASVHNREAEVFGLPADLLDGLGIEMTAEMLALVSRKRKHDCLSRAG